MNIRRILIVSALVLAAIPLMSSPAKAQSVGIGVGVRIGGPPVGPRFGPGPYRPYGPRFVGPPPAFRAPVVVAAPRPVVVAPRIVIAP